MRREGKFGVKSEALRERERLKVDKGLSDFLKKFQKIKIYSRSGSHRRSKIVDRKSWVPLP